MNDEKVFEIYLVLSGCKSNNYIYAIHRILLDNNISFEELISNADYYIYQYAYGDFKELNKKHLYSCALKKLKLCFVNDTITFPYKVQKHDLTFEYFLEIKSKIKELDNDNHKYIITLDHFEPGCIEIFINIMGIVSAIGAFINFYESCRAINFVLKKGKMDKLHQYNRLEVEIIKKIASALLIMKDKCIYKLGFDKELLKEIIEYINANF